MLPDDDLKKIEIGKPADFSFKKINSLDKIRIELARSSRLGSLPERGVNQKKFLTRSIWVNNNKLKTIKHLNKLTETVMEYPDQLGWIDFSFNYITEIDEAIANYPNLKIIYFHGNCIENLDEIFKLRRLKNLKTLTLHGNPISNLPTYRSAVIATLPQIINLDFTPVLKTEKLIPPPNDFVKRLKLQQEIEA